MKKILFLCLFPLAGCAVENENIRIYTNYVLPAEAQDWASSASLKELCSAAKNYCHKNYYEAALTEIYARNTDTRRCYFEKLPLTP